MCATAQMEPTRKPRPNLDARNTTRQGPPWQRERNVNTPKTHDPPESHLRRPIFARADFPGVGLWLHRLPKYNESCMAAAIFKKKNQWCPGNGEPTARLPGVIKNERVSGCVRYSPAVPCAFVWTAFFDFKIRSELADARRRSGALHILLIQYT